MAFVKGEERRKEGGGGEGIVRLLCRMLKGVHLSAHFHVSKEEGEEKGGRGDGAPLRHVGSLYPNIMRDGGKEEGEGGKKNNGLLDPFKSTFLHLHVCIWGNGKEGEGGGVGFLLCDSGGGKKKKKERKGCRPAPAFG